MDRSPTLDPRRDSATHPAIKAFLIKTNALILSPNNAENNCIKEQ